jgi:hypothetical protein
MNRALKGRNFQRPPTEIQGQVTKRSPGAVRVNVVGTGNATRNASVLVDDKQRTLTVVMVNASPNANSAIIRIQGAGA